jgi:hypothetical protein
MKKTLITLALMLGIVGTLTYLNAGWTEENEAGCVNSHYMGKAVVYNSMIIPVGSTTTTTPAATNGVSASQGQIMISNVDYMLYVNTTSSAGYWIRASTAI